MKLKYALLISNPFEDGQAVVIMIGLFALISGLGIIANSLSKDQVKVE